MKRSNSVRSHSVRSPKEKLSGTNGIQRKVEPVRPVSVRAGTNGNERERTNI